VIVEKLGLVIMRSLLLLLELLLAAFTPFGAVFDDPIGQSPLESYVVARLFRFNPFVFKYLVAFGLKLAVQRRLLHQIAAV